MLFPGCECPDVAHACVGLRHPAETRMGAAYIADQPRVRRPIGCDPDGIDLEKSSRVGIAAAST